MLGKKESLANNKGLNGNYFLIIITIIAIVAIVTIVAIFVQNSNQKNIAGMSYKTKPIAVINGESIPEYVPTYLQPCLVGCVRIGLYCSEMQCYDDNGNSIECDCNNYVKECSDSCFCINCGATSIS